MATRSRTLFNPARLFGGAILVAALGTAALSAWAQPGGHGGHGGQGMHGGSTTMAFFRPQSQLRAACETVRHIRLQALPTASMSHVGKEVLMDEIRVEHAVLTQ